jgi:hypothetical protein
VNKDLELWQFIGDRLQQNQPVMLLVVAESSGSSPGRQGYKMAVGSDGELRLCGKIQLWTKNSNFGNSSPTG